MAKKTLYDVLQVSRNADPETIKAAYKSLVQRYHPDKNPNNPDAVKHLKEINGAYGVLSDPVKRAVYDAALAEEDDDRINQTVYRASAEQGEKSKGEKSSNNSDADTSAPGSKHELYQAYLGEKNQNYYLEKFERFDRQGDGMHISLNWPASLFGIWHFYRKMYGWFLINVIAYAILSVVSGIIWEVVWKIRQAPPYLPLLYFVLILIGDVPRFDLIKA